MVSVAARVEKARKHVQGLSAAVVKVVLLAFPDSI